MRRRLYVLLMTIVPATFASQVSAQEPTWHLEGYAGVVSDYRYRGLSLSGNDPALQAGATITHAAGIYSTIELSSIDEYGIGRDGDGAEVELTVSSGWTGSRGGLEWDVGLSSFVYPDGSNVSYFEVPITLTKSLGNANWRTGFAYAPNQNALDDQDNGYIWGDVQYAPLGWPVSVSASLGYEEGAYALQGKVDWLLGVDIPLGPSVVSVHYIDSDKEAGEVVVGAAIIF